MYLLYRYALISNNSDALYTYSKENNWEGDIYIYIYTIINLFCENGFLREISHRIRDAMKSILSKTCQR